MVRTDESAERATLVHVRFDGRSFDVPLRDLEVANGGSDRDFKVALARYLDIGTRELEGYVVERHETGNFTVRPEAVFG